MAWIMDTYSMHNRTTVTAVVTGKPLNLGGSAGARRRPAGVPDGHVTGLEAPGAGSYQTRVVIQVSEMSEAWLPS